MDGILGRRKHLENLNSLDWDVFKEKILPLVGTTDDIQSKAERVAKILSYAWEKLGDNPGQHARFITTVRTVLDQMGWNDALAWLAPDEPSAATSTEDGARDEPPTAAEAGAAR